MEVALPVEVRFPVTPRVVEVALLKKAVVEEATLAKKLVVVASVNKPFVNVPRAEKKLCDEVAFKVLNWVDEAVVAKKEVEVASVNILFPVKMFEVYVLGIVVEA